MPFLNIFLLLLILNCHEGLKVTSFSYQCDNSFQTFCFSFSMFLFIFHVNFKSFFVSSVMYWYPHTFLVTLPRFLLN